MQDNYIGDIGDYGKYGLLRMICAEGLSLSVNWYRVTPRKAGKQDDGKYVHYLSMPQIYRAYDPILFDALYGIVCGQKDRRIKKIEESLLFPARFFSDEIRGDRGAWHQNALRQTAGTDTVFLDPDNGLETYNMFRTNGAMEKHVKWSELKDYYTRGQNVVLYQHRPQMTKKEQCIDSIMRFQKEYLKADGIRLLEFPKYTNRFYFFFLHKEFQAAFEKICRTTVQKWRENDFCREISV